MTTHPGPIEHFVVLGSQRSGTVYVGELISSHPQAHCWGEILLGMDGPTAARYPSFLNRHPKLRHGWQYVASGSAINPRHVVEQAYNAASFPSVGFRAMYNQLRSREIRHLTSDTLIRVIHVRRANTLRQFVSLTQMRARQRSLGVGSAHARGTEAKFAAAVVDSKAALRFVKFRQMEQDSFSRIFDAQTDLEIWYERDIEGRPTGHEPPLVAGTGGSDLETRIRNALHLEYAPLAASTRKSGSRDLSSAVPNFPDLHAAFSGTEFEWMLDN